MALIITPAVGPIFWLGHSYIDKANGQAIFSGAYRNTDQKLWGEYVQNFLGQAYNGRYAPEGSPPNPLGQCYGVAGVGIPGTNGVNQQIAKLIVDQGPILPLGCIVVIEIGINDINTSVNNLGGVWAGTGAAPTSWAVGASGGLTVPGSGTFTITVVSTTGMVAGASNFISFTAAAGRPYFSINTVNTGTTVTCNVGSFPGAVIPNNSPIVQSGVDYLNITIIPTFTTPLANLVAALPANGLIVLVAEPRTGYLPNNSGTVAASNATTDYFRINMALNNPITSKQVASWDMNSVFADVITNYPPANGIPSQFGVKNVTSGWNSAGTQAAADYFFWDGAHMTSAGTTLAASRFIQFLRMRGIISVY
jgi:hypothetical protein